MLSLLLSQLVLLLICFAKEAFYQPASCHSPQARPSPVGQELGSGSCHCSPCASWQLGDERGSFAQLITLNSQLLLINIANHFAYLFHPFISPNPSYHPAKRCEKTCTWTLINPLSPLRVTFVWLSPTGAAMAVAIAAWPRSTHNAQRLPLYVPSSSICRAIAQSPPGTQQARPLF